jgi:hypothetical protein
MGMIFPVNPRLLQTLRSLGADVSRLPEIPEELAEWIAGLTPTSLERIRRSVRELEKIGLLESTRKSKRSKTSMVPAVVKMPKWLHAAAKEKAGGRGLSAYLRELVIRDLAGGRQRKSTARIRQDIQELERIGLPLEKRKPDLP